MDRYFYFLVIVFLGGNRLFILHRVNNPAMKNIVSRKPEIF